MKKLFKNKRINREIDKDINKKDINIKKSGFTLVEIIIILFIISVGMIGVVSLVIQNIQSQVINKNNITAYQLAQEGIELTRKVRDTNWINMNDWRLGLANGAYYMDHLDETPHLITETNNGLLYQDASGYYIHEGGGNATQFTRTITITTLTPDSIRVDSNVSWSDRNRSFDYNLETFLYDWY